MWTICPRLLRIYVTLPRVGFTTNKKRRAVYYDSWGFRSCKSVMILTVDEKRHVSGDGTNVRWRRRAAEQRQSVVPDDRESVVWSWTHDSGVQICLIVWSLIPHSRIQTYQSVVPDVSSKSVLWFLIHHSGVQNCPSVVPDISGTVVLALWQRSSNLPQRGSRCIRV